MSNSVFFDPLGGSLDVEQFALIEKAKLHNRIILLEVVNGIKLAGDQIVPIILASADNMELAGACAVNRPAEYSEGQNRRN